MYVTKQVKQLKLLTPDITFIIQDALFHVLLDYLKWQECDEDYV